MKTDQTAGLAPQQTAGRTWSTQTANADDTSAPFVSSFTGSHSANPLGAGAPIVLTFNETIVPGSGNIWITDYRDNTVYTAAVDGPLVTIAGSTLTFASGVQFIAGATYRINFNGGTVLDLAGNYCWSSSMDVILARATGPLELAGTADRDHLIGGDAGDTLNGAGGQDTLDGHDGNDVLYGGDEANAEARGGDILSGGAGDDSLYGGEGQDGLYGNEGSNLLEGEGGDDSLLSIGDGLDTLRGGAGNDRLTSSYWGAASTRMEGGDGNDILDGSLDDTLLGGAGNDLLKISNNQFGGSGGFADGGDGDDTFEVDSWSAASAMTLTGGLGTNLYLPKGYAAVLTITDFKPGAGGDRIDLNGLISNIPGGNPFAGARPEMKLTQGGADTVLEFLSRETEAYVPVLRLSGIALTALTADNFVGGIDPGGSPDGLAITGTSAHDALQGDRMNDTLDGGAGADTIYGAAGDDVIIGGDNSTADGIDRLYGEDGNDTLLGGTGDDMISGGFGDDSMEGGEGNDSLIGTFGKDTIVGGAGDDRLTAGASGVVQGGAGNDEVRTGTTVAAHGNLAIDGGDGDDKIFFKVSGTGTVVISARGGAGADQFVIEYMPNGERYEIGDFSPAEGDTLDLRPMLPASLSGNPFGTPGYLRLTQQGADTLISVDRDGAAGGIYTWKDLITLAGVSASSLTAGAFIGNYDPSGTVVGVTRTGTDGVDTLSGTSVNDTIYGLAGADWIDGEGGDDYLFGGDEVNVNQGDHLFGRGGNDMMDGGAGADSLDGGEGRDWLEGGPGADFLTGGAGNDSLFGSDGNDTLTDYEGDDTLSGLDGDDRISTSSWTISLLSGGLGNDTLSGAFGDHTLLGNDGNDTITVNAAHSTYQRLMPVKMVVEGGNGNDTIVLEPGTTGSTVTAEGGAGSDTYRFLASPLSVLTVSDFLAGSGGDVLDLLAIWPQPFPFTGNPFGPAAFLRLVQDGADTLLQLDEDGAAGSAHALRTIVVLKGVNAAQLTLDNFSGGLRPDGGGAGLSLAGTDSADVLTGGVLDDVVAGAGGNDTIHAGAGNDTADGGIGNDTIHGSDGDDSLMGGDGNDRLEGGAGANVLDGGAGHDYLTGEDGADALTGGGGDDHLFGGDGDNTILGGIGHDYLYGGAGNNAMDGGDGDDYLFAQSGGDDSVSGGAGNDTLVGSGDDTLSGGAGNDTLTLTMAVQDGGSTSHADGGDGDDRIMVGQFDLLGSAIIRGGAGADTFGFSTNNAPQSAVIVTDYQPGVDRIDLEGLLPYAVDNPFASGGQLRFVQRGADAVLQLDSDGTASPYHFRDVLTLAGVNVSSLTANDIVDGSAPDGSALGWVRTGTDGADTITGGRVNDTLDGGAGDDSLSGARGDDVIDGKSGNDKLDGGYGNDTLKGGDGNDLLVDYAGSNDIAGGEGNDSIINSSSAGSRLDGGAGHDSIDGGYGNDTMTGGDGDDTFAVRGSSMGLNPSVVVDGGTGADTVWLEATPFAMDISATGGAGVDTYRYRGVFAGQLHITDFQSGAGGDQFDLGMLANTWSSLVQNPFSVAGYLRLVQDGANTLLQYDVDGTGGTTHEFRTIAELAGVNASTLTSDNFAGGYSPDGSGTGLRLNGTDGNDQMSGGGLNDTLSGGLGADTLGGGLGDDYLDGGDGNDRLEDNSGINTLVGGSGNDRLTSRSGRNLLDGGIGNDVLHGGRNDTLIGGEGDDSIGLSTIYAFDTPTMADVDGGAGNDWFALMLSYWNQTARITGGAGSDTFEIVEVYRGVSYTVTDFQPGDGGDRIDLAYLMEWRNLTGNPFATPAFMRLVQRGADTVVQFDTDGADKPNPFEDVLVLEGVTASALTAYNLGGFAPPGLPAGPIHYTGTAGADAFDGGALDDTIAGGAGDDTLRGNEGNDAIDGGAGNDVLDGGAGNDELADEGGQNTLRGGAGDDLLRVTGTLASALYGDVGNDRLHGDGGNDTLSGGAGADLLSGGAGDDEIDAGGGGDTVSGGAGNDRIDAAFPAIGTPALSVDGGAGNDLIRLVFDDGSTGAAQVLGGSGSDTFALLGVPPDMQLVIGDFSVANDDVLDLRALLPSEGATSGYLRAEQAGADTVIWYDRDGAGGSASTWQPLLTLTGVDRTTLAAANFAGGVVPDLPDTALNLQGGDGADTLNGATLDDTLLGGAGDDVLNGGSGNDILYGGAGHDALDGGAGNDQVETGGGNDTANGGAGNDAIRIHLDSDNTATVRATGGSGSDTFAVVGGAVGAELSISDFSVADGDVLDLLALLAPQARTTSGVRDHLRAEQVGSDTVIWFDRDGMGVDSFGWRQLVTLKGVDRSSLTAAHFADGLAPHLQDVPVKFIGADAADSVAGGMLDDTLSGLSGDDTLAGHAGNDLLLGDEGMDSLTGGSGDDSLFGGIGDDWLTDVAGNDHLQGDAGNDFLHTSSTGSSVLDGGDGDDTLSGGAGNATLSGGLGNDLLQVAGGATAPGLAILLDGGSGTDTYHFSGMVSGVRVAGFQAGAGGDRLDLLSLLPAGHADLGNPFGPSGMLRVVQTGGGAEIQVDEDGAAGMLHGWRTVALLEGVAADTLNADNFAPSMVPNRPPIMGTAGDDFRTGSSQDDTIFGLDGADNLSGLSGDDTLDGGAGNDSLWGGDGNDLLDGGAGNDYLSADSGIDTLHGGAGADQMDVYGTSGVVDGGDGDDWIIFNSSVIGTHVVTIDGGAGNDNIQVDVNDSAIAQVHVLGGSGSDTFTVYSRSTGSSVTIGDFSAAEGDVLDFRLLLPQYTGNPFGQQGHLRAEQVGSDTVIWFDRDGAAGSEYTWQRLATLTGIDKSHLTAASFAGGFDLAGLDAPVQLNGQGGADGLVGSVFADTLSGGAGNDTLGGGGGNDRLDGGTGNDRLQGHAGNDTIDGGSGNDIAVFAGDASKYTWSLNGGTIIVESKDGLTGTDTLTNVERIAFSGMTLAFDVGADGTAGEVYRLYQAAFGRTPDSAGLSWWLKAADAGMSLVEISGHFMQSPEFASLYGVTPNTAELVRALYVNALHREPDEGGVAYWTQVLDKGYAAPEVVLTGFSESEENQESVAKVIGTGITLGPWT